MKNPVNPFIPMSLRIGAKVQPLYINTKYCTNTLRWSKTAGKRRLITPRGRLKNWEEISKNNFLKMCGLIISIGYEIRCLKYRHTSYVGMVTRRECGVSATPYCRADQAAILPVFRRPPPGDKREKMGRSGTKVAHTHGTLPATFRYTGVFRPPPLDGQSDGGIPARSGGSSGSSLLGGARGWATPCAESLGEVKGVPSSGCITSVLMPLTPCFSVSYLGNGAV
jgi:hypothetical protein